MNKTCRRCEEVKPVSEFSIQRASKDGFQSYCRSCHKVHLKKYREANPLADRLWQLKTRYNLNKAEFDSLWEDHNGRCAICAEELVLGPSGFVIDHNHSTGEVRGVLCSKCNRGLGFFQDNPEILQSATNYLKTKGHYG